MNLTLALPSALREVSIDGVQFVLVRKSALDALYPNGAAADHATTRSLAARAASVKISRPAPKKLKAPSPKPAARATAAPDPEASEPVNGTLRAAVLAEIQQNPGQTTVELFDQIRKAIPTTTIGSVYQSAKALCKKDLVKGQPSKEGTIWHPARSA